MRTQAVALTVALLMMTLAPLPMHSGGSGGSPPPRERGSVPSIEFLIVTSEDMMENMAPLASWKNTLGIPTEIVLLSDILSASEGRDDAERLFNYVSARYSSSGGNLSALLLGGDSEVIPTRYLHAGAASFGLDDEYLSDVYYSSPGAAWDPDADGMYGEADGIDPNMTFPISVGRIPASTPEEMANYVSKVITYESNPPEGDWTKTMIMASSLMDRPNVTDDPGTPEDEGYDPVQDNGRIAMDRLESVLPYYIDTVEMDDYPQYWGLNYSSTNDTLDYGTLPSLISSGASAVSFAGQSFYDADVWDPPTAYSLAQWFDPTGSANGSLGFQPALSSEDIPDLANGGMLPVAYFSSCDSANFSDPTDSDLSGIVFGASGGAICMVGSTGISWRGEYSEGGYGNWFLLPAFWERLYGNGLPGRALFDLKQVYLRSYFGFEGFSERVLANLYGYNYIGDPTLRAWTAAPLTLNITFEPDRVHAGGEEVMVTVSTSGGSPISGARVSIFIEGSDPFVSFTGPDGEAVVGTLFIGPGSATVTASSRGYLPLSRSITVLEWPPDPSIIASTLRISPSEPTESSPLSISVDVKNEGGPLKGPVTMGMFEARPGAEPWPDPISVVSLDIPSGDPVTFHLNVTAPLRTWRSLTLGIYPPSGEIDLSDDLLTFPIYINGGPMLLPGRINMTEDSSIFEDLDDHVFDPDAAAGSLEYSVGAGTPDWIELTGGHFLRISPPADWSGDIDIPVRVSDGMEHVEGSLALSVIPVNDPPVLRGIGGDMTCRADRPFILDLDPYDAEGEALTFELIGAIEGLTITGYALRIVPTEDQIGVHSIVINVSDPEGAFTIWGFNLSISAASMALYFSEPSVHLPDATVGEAYEHAMVLMGEMAENATFSDNTTLFDIDPASGIIAFVPGDDDVGEHWVRITASSGNESASRAFVIVVKPDEGYPTWLVWALALAATVLLATAIALFVWRGRRVPQYGEE